MKYFQHAVTSRLISSAVKALDEPRSIKVGEHFPLDVSRLVFGLDQQRYLETPATLFNNQQ